MDASVYVVLAMEGGKEALEEPRWGNSGALRPRRPEDASERAKIAEEYGDTPGQGMAGDRGHRSAVYRKPLMAIIEPSPMSLPRLRSTAPACLYRWARLLRCTECGERDADFGVSGAGR